MPYVGAVIATALAALACSLLDPASGDRLPLATMIGAVAVAVWLGGYRPSLLAIMVLGYIASAYLFVEPRGKVLPLNARRLARMNPLSPALSAGGTPGHRAQVYQR
jgi:hypothetical protein